MCDILLFSCSFILFQQLLFYIFCIFYFHVGAGRTRCNSKPKVYTGLDLLFADVPENLCVPGISSSLLDVPEWNKRSSTYFEVLFAFANANLHDNGVLIFSHAADLDVSRSIHNWAHTEDFYIAEDWFGMNDLDLQSPTNPSNLVSPFWPHHFVFFFFPFHICIANSTLLIFCRLASSSSRCSCVMNLF